MGTERTSVDFIPGDYVYWNPGNNPTYEHRFYYVKTVDSVNNGQTAYSLADKQDGSVVVQVPEPQGFLTLKTSGANIGAQPPTGPLPPTGPIGQPASGATPTPTKTTEPTQPESSGIDLATTLKGFFGAAAFPVEALSIGMAKAIEPVIQRALTEALLQVGQAILKPENIAAFTQAVVTALKDVKTKG